MQTWEAALEARSELTEFGRNRLLLFALALHQDIDDIELVANDILTDGSNDKKCDLMYLNPETGKAIIAQGYWSESADNTAPANKASDLNTAAAWLLGSSLKGLPDGLRAAAEQLQHGLDNDLVTSIEFWYVHNLVESKNVESELDKVVQTATSVMRTYHPKAQVDSVTATEVGKKTLEMWYRGTQAPILVTKAFRFETKGGFRTDGSNWSAYSTSVPAMWLRNMFLEHGKSLFSANVRDYLGSRQTDKNINHNIKQTAKEDPEMFWVYNNGITALVNDFEYTSEDDVGMLEVTGIAIVNGAQTTGALGSLNESELGEAFVPARFVKCTDATIVREIIRYNNSQNKIEAADFRSNDPIQTRLRTEFKGIKNVEYTGGRRGGVEDVMKRPRQLIPSYSAGQALMALHGEPAIAYNRRSGIWQNDTLYSKVFNENTSARHILFAFSLLKAVDEAKGQLRTLDDSQRTEAQNRQWEVLRQRGATFLLTSAISAGLETILGRPIPDKFALAYLSKIILPEAVQNWAPVIEVALPLVNRLGSALGSGNLNNRVTVQSAIEDFVDMLSAVKAPNAATFDSFSQKIVITS